MGEAKEGGQSGRPKGSPNGLAIWGGQRVGQRVRSKGAAKR